MAEFPTDSQHDEATWRQLKQDAALLLSEDPHDGTGTRDAAVQCVRPVVSAAASVSVDPIEALRPPPSAALVTRRSHSRQPKVLQDFSINCQGPWLMHACSATRPTSETNAATVLQAAHRGRAARRQSTRRVPNDRHAHAPPPPQPGAGALTGGERRRKNSQPWSSYTPHTSRG